METDFSTEPIPAKAAEAEKARVHTMITIGGRDMKAGAVSVRLHDDGQQGAKPKAEVLARYKDWPLSTAADADKLRRWTMEERGVERRHGDRSLAAGGVVACGV